MIDILSTEITYLKGVGPKKAAWLKAELGIVTFEDLLNYYPFRYVDKSKIYKVKDVITDTTYFQLRGKVSNLVSVGDKRTQYITATFEDDTGSIGLVWFKGVRWIKKRFEPGKEYLIFGKPSVFKNRFNFVHPEVEDIEGEEVEIGGQRLEGIYSSTEKLKNTGLGTKGITRLMKTLLNQTSENIGENLPSYLIEQYKLLDRKKAIVNILLQVQGVIFLTIYCLYHSNNTILYQVQILN